MFHYASISTLCFQARPRLHYLTSANVIFNQGEASGTPVQLKELFPKRKSCKSPSWQWENTFRSSVETKIPLFAPLQITLSHNEIWKRRWQFKGLQERRKSAEKEATQKATAQAEWNNAIAEWSLGRIQRQYRPILAQSCPLCSMRLSVGKAKLAGLSACWKHSCCDRKLHFAAICSYMYW